MKFTPLLSALSLCLAAINASGQVISMSPSRVVEGNTGSTQVSVPLYLSATQTTAVTVNWATGNDTATAGTDFTAASGIVTFAAGEVYKVVNVSVTGDGEMEFDEHFTVNLSNPSGATLADTQVRVLIQNDERYTTVALPERVVWFEKPVQGQSPVETITVGNPTAGRSAVLTLTGGTASVGSDIALATSTVGLGGVNPPLPLRGTDDALEELDETFELSVSSNSPAVRVLPRALRQSIPLTQTPLAIEIEGNLVAVADGVDVLLFRKSGDHWTQEATIAGAAEGGVYSVALDGGLVAADFQSTGVRIFEKVSGTWTQQGYIPRANPSVPDTARRLKMSDGILAIGDSADAGQTSVSGQVRIHVRHQGGRNTWGLAQTLSPTGIRNDFGASLSMWGALLAVGAPGNSTASLYRRDPVSRVWTRVLDYTGDSFSSYGAYCALNGETLAIASRYSSVLFSRRSDNTSLIWSAPAYEAVPDSFDNGLFVENTFVQNRFGQAAFRTAQPNNSWSWYVYAGPTAGTFGNSSLAANRETLVLANYRDSGWKLDLYESDLTKGTVIDDDAVRFSVDSANFVEGTSSGLVFVRLSRSLPVDSSVLVTTADGTAQGGLDFEWNSTWVNFPAGNNSRIIYFSPYADGLIEPAETVQFQLEFPSVGSVISPGIGTITDAPLPVVYFAATSASVIEGNPGGTSNATLTANLTSAAPLGASFTWTATSGTAVLGQDFLTASGTVAVPQGATQVTFSVPVSGDDICEPTENFTVRIGNFVTLAGGSPDSATVTITNDDTGTPQPDSYTMVQNTVLSGVNVRDNDCSALAVSVATQPAYGTLALNASGSFVYTPPANFIGTTSFTYNGGSSGGGGGTGTELVSSTALFRWYNPQDGVNPSTANPDWNTDWPSPSFNDSAWGTGSGLMGYGLMSSSSGDLSPNTDIGTPPSGMRRTAYFRHKFNVAQAGTYDLELSISRDDAAIVYINGIEVVRSREAGATLFASAPDTWDLMVEGNSSAWTAGVNEGNPYTHTITGVNLNAGLNTLAISGHNNMNPSAPTSSDLGVKVFYLRTLSGGGTPPAGIPVTITVTDAQMPPLLTSDAYSITEDTVLNTSAAARPALFTNDGILNTVGTAFDPILEVATQDVTGGTVSSLDPATGHFVFTPASNFSGAASFRYRVRDKDGWSLPALVTINVADDFALPALQRLNPLGSRLFRSSTAVTFASTSAVVDAAIPLKAGQTVSLSGRTSAPLGVVSLLSPAGITVPGGTVRAGGIDNIPITADGTYIISAGQPSGSLSGTISVLVNGGLPDFAAASTYDLNTASRPAVWASMSSTAAQTYQLNAVAGELLHVYVHGTAALPFRIENAAATLMASSSVSPHAATASTLTWTPSASEPCSLIIPGVSGASYTLQVFRGGITHEYSAASAPLLSASGCGYLSGPGGTETGVTFASFGDYGSASSNELAVSQMVKSWNPDFIVAVGDHNYSNDFAVGSTSWTQRVGNFYGEYILGRADNRYPEQTSPTQRYFVVPGNHDTGPNSANGGELSGYFDYFYTNPGGSPRLPDGVHEPMLSYYKAQWGNMEFYFLDSDNAVGNSTVAAQQRQWLKDQIALSTAQWKFGVWHHPPYSSSAVHGNHPVMQFGADWAGLTAILCGHDHIYERLDAGNGVMQFVTGLGGMSIYPLSVAVPQSQFRYNSTYGAMKIATGSSGVKFEFRAIGAAGGTLIDSYTIGSPPGQSVATGTDTWSLRVLPGQTLHFSTATPAAPGTLSNTINPAIQLLDDTGAVMATDADSAADGINASLYYTIPAIPNCPPEGCLWSVKIYNESSGAGEYTLNVSNAANPSDAYDTWAAANLPASQRAQDADPDGDGAPNLMEFLASTAPGTPGTAPLTFLPGGWLTLNLPATWTRPVRAQLQVSTSLSGASWSTVATKSGGTAWTGPGPLPASAPGGFSYPPATGARLFYRMVFVLE